MLVKATEEVIFIRKRYYHIPKNPVLRIVSILLTVLTVFLFYIDIKLRPALCGIAKTAAKQYAVNYMNKAMSKTLNDNSISYDDIIHISNAADGSVVSVTASASQINRIKTDMIEYTANLINSSPAIYVGLPIGNVTDINYFSGMGPTIRMKINVYSNVNTDIVSKFESSGINQTIHEIIMTVRTDIYIILPGGCTSVTVSTDYLLADSIIVGKVPDAYTNVFESGTSEDVSSDLANYKAKIN